MNVPRKEPASACLTESASAVSCPRREKSPQPRSPDTDFLLGFWEFCLHAPIILSLCRICFHTSLLSSFNRQATKRLQKALFDWSTVSTGGDEYTFGSFEKFGCILQDTKGIVKEAKWNMAFKT